VRGSNLFHSFEVFNVDTGLRVYFANPAGIENILSRVTGGSLTTIDGLLGVDGAANLFLLNPNGVMFGPNARLDISGSFLTSTGSRLTFADGSEFSAVPTGAELLTVSVPLGVQFNHPQGDITSTGILETGQDLTLLGRNLNLEGQLRTGGDLTLQAADTLQIRDMADQPFVAAAGGNLLVQGNQTVDIFALNHGDSGLLADGDLTLRSATPVIGDAHYQSGGNFRIEQLDEALGALISPNDPVIRAAGDVEFQSYEGASLHVFAGGSVTVPGAITITGADPINGIVETVTLSDGSTMEINGRTTPTLDIRAGILAVNPVTIGDAPEFELVEPATSADITIGSIRNGGGTVFLTNQYQPNLALAGGDIEVGYINTSDDAGGDGGLILLEATGNITTTSSFNAPFYVPDWNEKQVSLGSYSYSDSSHTGRGGDIALRTDHGDINISSGSLVSASVVGNNDEPHYVYKPSSTVPNPGDVGDGGNISLSTNTGNIILTKANTVSHSRSYISSSDPEQSSDSGAGGNISFYVREYGNISLNGSISSADSYSYSGGAGVGGNISFYTHSGDIELVNSYVDTDSGNCFHTDQCSGSAERAGSVSLETNSGHITLAHSPIWAGSYSAFTKIAGIGGEIDIIANMGDIRLNSSPLISYSYSYTGNVQNGGNIFLSANKNIDINSSGLFSSSSSNLGRAQDGGSITLIAGNDIKLWGELNSVSVSHKGDTGNGGDIKLQAGNSIQGFDNGSGRILTFTASENPGSTTQRGGDVDIKASTQISDLEILTLSSDDASGSIKIQGLDNLEIHDLDLTTSAEVTIPNPMNYMQLFIDTAGIGQSGNTEITAAGDLTFENVHISSNANGAHSGGSIRVEAVGDITFAEGSTIHSNANSNGDAGSIEVIAGGEFTLQDSELATVTFDVGDAGNIVVDSLTLSLEQGSQISASTSKAGHGGDIDVKTSQLFIMNGSKISASTTATGDAGNITINTSALSLEQGSQISASTSKTGHGGDIVLKSTGDTLNISGDGEITVETLPESVGNAGDFKIDVLTLNISGTSLTAATSGRGNGGNIDVTTNQLFITDKGEILVETEGVGDAGNIKIKPSVLGLDQGSQISASTKGPGNGGSIILYSASDTLNLLGNGVITVETKGAGTAGRLGINVPNLNINSTYLTTATTGDGDGGDIVVAANLLSVTNNGKITASTEGTGTGGSVTLKASDIRLDQGGQIAASTSGTGNGGNILFNPTGDTLNISGNGSITVETSGTGPAGSFADTHSFATGNVRVAIPHITIDGARLTASTRGPQAGGNIAIATSQLTFANHGAIAASTSGPGPGGNLTIYSEGPLTLSGNGQLTVASMGANSGQAGNLNIVSGDTLRLSHGVELAASSASMDGGGNMNLAIAGNLFLSDGSFINAASSHPLAGNGGNITMHLPDHYLIALAGQNNDIIANAVGGNGGEIDITALRLLGIHPLGGSTLAELRSNRTNDISASSEFGFNGLIALNTLALDPSQGLVELPLDLTDRTNQIIPACGIGNVGGGQSQFVMTGQGGLPATPGDPLTAQGVNVPSVTSDSGPAVAFVQAPSLTAELPLVEAHGLVIDASGNAYLVAAGDPQTGQTAVSSPPVCSPFTGL
jgi:filamentous hemagglutinin family protein